MAYDPNFPPDHQALIAAPFRAQFNALKALIDAQQAQITALQNAVAGRALMPQLSEFDPSINDPPTAANLEEMKDYIKNMAQQLTGATW